MMPNILVANISIDEHCFIPISANPFSNLLAVGHGTTRVFLAKYQLIQSYICLQSALNLIYFNRWPDLVKISLVHLRVCMIRWTYEWLEFDGSSRSHSVSKATNMRQSNQFRADFMSTSWNGWPLAMWFQIWFLRGRKLLIKCSVRKVKERIMT